MGPDMLVALVPAPNRRCTLKLRLRVANDETEAVEIRLTRGGMFSRHDAREQIQRLLRFPQNSAVSRAYRRQIASGQERAHALDNARGLVKALADLLRRQFSAEDSNIQTGTPVRRQVLADLERELNRSLERLEEEQTKEN